MKLRTHIKITQHPDGRKTVEGLAAEVAEFVRLTKTMSDESAKDAKATQQAAD